MKSYTFKKFKKQLLPYLLSFAIVLGAFSWKAPEADAIATEAVVAAIISVAIGSGLAFAVDRMTSPEVDAYWTGQAQQWLQSIGQSYSDFVDQAEQNMSAKDGKLILGGSFYQSIQNFLSWWKGENGVEVGAQEQVFSTSMPFVIDNDGVSHNLAYKDTLGNWVYPPSPSYSLGDAAKTYNFGDRTVSLRTNGSKIGYQYTSPTYNPSYQYITDLNSHVYLALDTLNPSTRRLCLVTDTGYFTTLFVASNLGNLLHADLLSMSVSQPSDEVVLEPTEALPSVALDVGASSEDDLETVIRAIFDGYRDNTLVVDQELTGAGEGEGTDTDGLFGILHGISGTLSDVLDAVLSIPAALAATVTGFIGSIGNFLSGAYFGFSGIWHYVVSWVGSMAAGAAVIWSIWNGLPAAMVIPVYATAVIVIVVGLWRRFFE